MKIVGPQRLQRALIAHGLVPPNCKLLDVVVSPTGPPVLRYEVFLDETDLRKFADAFAEALKDDGRTAPPILS
jgi:hypothetical protein